MHSEPRFLRLRKGCRPAPRTFEFEPLESRIALSATAAVDPIVEEVAQPLHDMMPDTPVVDGVMYPGGVTVTPTQIITHMDTIPRFAANPTITAVRTGLWSDPGAWSAGRVPREGDRVVIGEGKLILYNQQSNIRLDAVEVSGNLIFQSNVNTRMLVANLTVMPTGILTIGNQSSPIQASVTAELIIADKPLNLATDPSQYGTGLIGFGKISIRGQEIAQTWQRLVSEASAGSRILWLTNAVTDWKAGDTLVLPDSRQVKSNSMGAFRIDELSPQWEEVVVEQVLGKMVLLKEPLKYDHLGARNSDGQLELLPHVAVLTRNVTVRSENAAGTRGHTLFTGRADVDIEYAQFIDLGRTDAMRPLDSTTYDANGMVTHIGTNQIARYAVHFHHLLGPENPTNTGYQFVFVGNSVANSLKWAVDVHGTSFGLVDKNVVYNAQGAGIVTENGSEIGNVFSNNITIRMQGTHVDGKEGTAENDYGRGGVGFWFRRGGNTIVGNVSTNNTYAGFVFDGYYLTAPAPLPLFRGADIHDPMQTTAGTSTPGTQFLNNEAYGWSSFGLWAAFVNRFGTPRDQETTLITNLKLWHISSRMVWTYHTSNLIFDQLLILSNHDAQDRNDSGTVGMNLSLYENYNLVIRNSRIEGTYYGIIAPNADASTPGNERPTFIENTVLKNYINVLVTPASDLASGNILELRNVRFTILPNTANGPYPVSWIKSPANIMMSYTGTNIDYTRPSIVRVYDYNGVSGDNFQVFYNEQTANFVMPKTNVQSLSSRDAATVGSPSAGLTNAQNWARYGIATAGAVAPSNAQQSRPGILGLVAPIQTPQSVPRVVLVTPWDNSTLTSSFMRIRYTVNGVVPAGALVYFRLDGGDPVSTFGDGGFFGMTRGAHTLEAYIGDATGKRLSGTSNTISRFVVQY